MAWRITTWWKRCFERLRGARFVSPLFCEFSLVVVVLGCFVFCCVFGLLWFFLVKILHRISVSLHCEFPVVDRLCLVLARQCRKKRRFIYGDALDHSEFPCYVLWPCRDQEEYWLVDTMTNRSFKLSTETYFRPLGLHHFYDAFSLEGRANLRQDALAQFKKS